MKLRLTGRRKWGRREGGSHVDALEPCCDRRAIPSIECPFYSRHWPSLNQNMV